jgi:hypothetical protein
VYNSPQIKKENAREAFSFPCASHSYITEIKSL